MRFSNQSAVLGLALLLVGGTGFLGWQLLHRAEHVSLSQREVATRVLAEYLAKKNPTEPVLVISNPFSQRKGRTAQVQSYQEAGVAGLRKGFGGKVELKVVFPELKPEVLTNPGSISVDPNSTTPLSFLVAERAFDDLIRKHPECRLAVTLIGLPVNLAAVEGWTKPGAPKFALLLPDWRVIGTRAAIQDAFTSGKIAAAVMDKPDAPQNSAENPGPYQEEFAKRYLLVTPETVDTMMQSYPRSFPE